MTSGVGGVVTSDWKHLAAKMMINTNEIQKYCYSPLADTW